MEERYIGLILAMLSSVFIGTSFIITKLGLQDAARRNGVVLGEVANFAAYSYAPAILVTPLGAGSVIIGAILAHFLLGERLGMQGTMGAALSLIGSIVIILHSPEEKPVDSVEEILDYALQPAFLSYMIIVTGISLYLIYWIAPRFGKKSMLVYLTICSLVGSISVMASKGFGIALKLTFSGSNQLFYPSTYVFGLTVVVCAVTQINYFNKALEIFSTNRVTPVYYVFFTTATIIASVLLFQGFHHTTSVEVVTVLCGFFTIFIGVYELTSAKAHKEMYRTSSHSLEKITQYSNYLSSDELDSAKTQVNGLGFTPLQGYQTPSEDPYP